MKILHRLALLLVTVSYARVQAQGVHEIPDLTTITREHFANLDPGEVPTGYLMDVAIGLAPLSEYDGTELTTDDGGVTGGLYEDLYATAASTAVSQSSYNVFADRPHLDHVSLAGETAHLTGLIFGYNFLSAQAVAEGRVVYDEGSESLVRTRSGEIYDEATAAVFSIGEYFISNETKNYVFDRSDLVSDTWTYSYFEIDRGSGFERVNFGEPFDRLESDLRTGITLRLTTGHGTVYGRIDVSEWTREQPVNSRVPCSERIIGFSGGTITEIVNISGQECGGCELDNPLIVVNGFDDGNDGNRVERLTTEFLVSTEENGPYAGLTLEESLLDIEGYDLLFVDFTDGTASNFTTADWLINAMGTIEEMKEAAGIGGMEVPMIGVSMGGLVSKIALSRMEAREMPHYVNKWITFDSPLRGAYIPLGTQHLLHHIVKTEIWGTPLIKYTKAASKYFPLGPTVMLAGEFVSGKLQELGSQYTTLTSPGAQEMLLYSVEATVKYRPGFPFSPSIAKIEHNVTNELHNDFQDKFDSYTHTVPHYAISNGAFEQDQTEVEPGFTADLGVSTDILSVDLVVPAAPSANGLNASYIFLQARNLPRAFKVQHTRAPLFSSKTYRATHDDITPNLDLVPGGTRAFDVEVEVLGTTHINYNQFVPTTSAQNLPLDASLAVSGPGVDYRVIPTNELLESRTDDAFQVFNHEHVAVTPQIATFLIDALSLAGRTINPQNATPVTRTEPFNFGAGVIRGVRRQTPTVLYGNHVVTGNGSINVNATARIAESNNQGNPVAATEAFTVRLSENECAGPARVTLEAGSSMQIGSPGRPATLIMEPNTRLYIKESARLEVAAGSKIVMGTGAKIYTYEGGSIHTAGTIEVELGAQLYAYGGSELHIDGRGLVKVSVNSSIYLYEGTRVQVGGPTDGLASLLIESGRLFLYGAPDYTGGGTLHFTGEPSVYAYEPFKLRGSRSNPLRMVLENATVHMRASGDMDLRHVEATYVGTSSIVATKGSKISLEEVVFGKDILTDYNTSTGISAEELESLRVDNAKFTGLRRAIELGRSSENSQSGNISISASHFEGSKVYLSEAESAHLDNINFEAYGNTAEALVLRDIPSIEMDNVRAAGYQQGYKPYLNSGTIQIYEAEDVSIHDIDLKDNDLGLRIYSTDQVAIDECSRFLRNYQALLVDYSSVSVRNAYFSDNSIGINGGDIQLDMNYTQITHDCNEPFLTLRMDRLPAPSAASPIDAEYNLWNGSTSTPSTCLFRVTDSGSDVTPYIDTYPRSREAGCQPESAPSGGEAEHMLSASQLVSRSSLGDPADDKSRNAQAAMVVSPNPATSELDVVFEEFTPSTLKVLNSNGVEVVSRGSLLDANRIYVDHLPAGLYHVVAVDQNGGQLSTSLLVQR